MSKVLILLTACIRPEIIFKTKLLDSNIRKEQYEDALKYYLNSTFFDILFIDNSGVNLSEEFKDFIESGRLEIICFNGQNYPSELGKGFGEMGILEYAMQYSSKIDENTCLVKITGRLKLLNINILLNKVMRSVKSEKFVSADFVHSFKAANSRIFIANSTFYKDFLFKFKNKLNDSKCYYFEHALRDAIYLSLKDNYQYIAFPLFTRFLGISGTFNKAYNTNYIYYLLRSVWCIIKGWRFKFKNIK